MATDRPRFTPQYSTVRYKAWGVHDFADDVFIWWKRDATEEMAKALATALNLIVRRPTGVAEVHAQAVRLREGLDFLDPAN